VQKTPSRADPANVANKSGGWKRERAMAVLEAYMGSDMDIFKAIRKRSA
jgi:hypothetical protein